MIYAKYEKLHVESANSLSASCFNLWENLLESNHIDKAVDGKMTLRRILGKWIIGVGVDGSGSGSCVRMGSGYQRLCSHIFVPSINGS
jgi:hypothetical protein